MVRRFFTVYRVEHATGNYGPYKRELMANNIDCLRLSSTLCNAHSNMEHPGILFDTMFAVKESQVCGFESLQQLNRWFKGFGKALRKAGYVVKVYKVKEYVKTLSGLQIAFEKPIFPYKVFKLDNI
jgi:hypothetical protein